MIEVKKSSISKIPIRLMSTTPVSGVVSGTTGWYLSVPLTGVSSPTVYVSINGSSGTQWTGPSWSAAGTGMPGLYWLTTTTSVTSAAGPLVVGISAVGAVLAVMVLNVVDDKESDLSSSVVGIPYSVWSEVEDSAEIEYTEAGQRMALIRKLLTNQYQDSGSTIVVFDDDDYTPLGDYTWTGGTTRGRFG